MMLALQPGPYELLPGAHIPSWGFHVAVQKEEQEESIQVFQTGRDSM